MRQTQSLHERADPRKQVCPGSSLRTRAPTDDVWLGAKQDEDTFGACCSWLQATIGAKA
jgi:hypothetical protein